MDDSKSALVVIVEDLVDTADDVQERKEKTITELRGAGIANCISINVPVACL